MSRKTYDTPKRRRVVKTRMTDEEYADFADRCEKFGINQSEFIRQAIATATVKPIIYANLRDDSVAEAVSRLIGEYGKIGSNLNQIARVLNESHATYAGLEREVRDAAVDMAMLKFEVLKVIGDAYGNDKAYRL